MLVTALGSRERATQALLTEGRRQWVDMKMKLPIHRELEGYLW